MYGWQQEKIQKNHAHKPPGAEPNASNKMVRNTSPTSSWYVACLTSYYVARFYWARAMAWVRGVVASAMGYRAAEPSRWTGWTVSQALLFREQEDGETDVENDFVSLPKTLIDFDMPDLLEFVDHIAPDEWKSWKLELRCLGKKGSVTKKRRIVVRRGETMQSIQEECESLPSSVIIGAFFLADRTDTTFTAKRMDITQRVKKYVIHPDRVLLCKDLFPMDDPDSWVDDPPRNPGVLVHGWKSVSGAMATGFTFTEILSMDESLHEF